MRLATIDTLRGAACLLLVLYHVVGSNPANGLRLEDGALRQLNDGLVFLRMPLFALLAGLAYGLGRQRTAPLGVFVRHQAQRLLLPMLTVGTLFAVLQAATPQANGAPRDWTTLHLEPVAHFWFLEALFWVLLLVHGLDRLGALERPRRVAACWLGAVTLSLSWRGPHWLAIDGAVYLLPYALAGVALGLPGLADRLRGRLPVLLLIVALGVGLVALGPPRPDPNRRHVAMLLASTSACLLLVAWRPQVTGLAALGRHAYPVFLFHPFFSAAARMALSPWDGVPMALQVLAGVGAGVVGPLLLDRALRPHPVLRLGLMGLGRRPSGSPAETPGRAPHAVPSAPPSGSQRAA